MCIFSLKLLSLCIVLRTVLIYIVSLCALSYTLFCTIITALHVMQTRYSEEISVCPSVCLSVCHTRGL